MDEFIHLSVPCYYTQRFKTKKDKTFLVGMNWYRVAHYHIKNEVKVWFTNDILRQLKALDAKPIKGAYEVAFKYYYRNPTSDLMNVCGLTSKHFNDAAEKYGLIENDNVKFCKKECAYVAEQDKENPRVEVFIRGIKE
jgi:hypothetical protein